MINQGIFSEIQKVLKPLGVNICEQRIENGEMSIPKIEIWGLITGITDADKQRNPYIPSRILVSRDWITTVVFWQDGTKTIVKLADDEKYSPYAAFTAALAIKVLGSNSAVKRIVKRTEMQKPKKPKKQKG